MQLNKDSHLAYGRWSEKMALKYLRQKDYQLIQQDFRSPVGEIDLVMKKDSLLVFVEVRSRRNATFMHPKESITPNKLSHIQRAAEYFLIRNAYANMDIRFDLITITGNETSPQLEHFEGIS